MDNNINKRLNIIMKTSIKNDDIVPTELISEMYTIHNSLFNIKEYNEVCSKCRNRVYNNLKTYWSELKKEGLL